MKYIDIILYHIIIFLYYSYKMLLGFLLITSFFLIASSLIANDRQYYGRKYIVVESYKNDKQLFNLQCWALTCQTFLSEKEWIWLYKKLKYSGNYEFIYFN